MRAWRERAGAGLLRAAAGALVLAAVGAAAAAQAAEGIFTTREHDFRLVTVVEGLEHPWGLAFLPDGRMLVTERPGRLRLIDNGALHPRPLAGVPTVAANGQGGLLDVAIHPQFERNRWVYLSYAAAGAGGTGTEVARARLVEHRLEDTEIVFRALPKAGGGRHFGSRLLFGADGLLYITLGDRGERASAQDPSGHPGSIIRVHPDGGVPADNPLVGRAPARPEIFTYGNRNVQGIALQPDTGTVWAHEHGPQGGDELNVVRAGANFGWPIVTYGRNYGTGTQIGEGTHKAGMTPPVRHWVPSIAPSGMAFYSGDAFPRWRGDLFIGALKFRLLVRLEIEDGRVVEEERMLTDILGRIRDVRSGPDGFLYLLTDESKGVLARLEPVSR